MGNWMIHVEGVGPHHNDKYCDVEFLTSGFVKLLKKEGHKVSKVSIVTGSKAEVKEDKD